MEARPAVVIGIVAGVATAASAGSPSFFGDRGAFETAAAGAGVPLDGFESFENFPADDGEFFAELDADGFTVTSRDVNFDFLDPITVQEQASGGFPTDGDQLLSISSFDFTETTFTFDAPVFAAGLDLLAFGDFQGITSTIEGSINGGERFTIFDGTGTSGNTAFFGVVSGSAISTLTIFNNFDGDQYGIDAVSFGVPTPGAAGLLALGGLAAARRRR